MIHDTLVMSMGRGIVIWLFRSKRRTTWISVAAGLVLTLPSVVPLLGIKNTKKPEFTLSVPGFESAVDAVDRGKRHDLLCGLNPTDKFIEGKYSFWQATKFQEHCNFRGLEHLFVGDGPRGLTIDQILSAQDWYLEFLINEYFDSGLLGSDQDVKELASSGNMPFLHPETLPKLVNSPANTFELDGKIIYIDNVMLSGNSNSIFRALPSDRLPRLLGLQLKTGSLSVDFYGLGPDQVEFSGYVSAFYRLDKSHLVEFVLETEPQWTLSSLEEVHPQYFDESSLAMRYDARVSHTLEKSADSWLIKSWDSSGISFDY